MAGRYLAPFHRDNQLWAAGLRPPGCGFLNGYRYRNTAADRNKVLQKLAPEYGMSCTEYLFPWSRNDDEAVLCANMESVVRALLSGGSLLRPAVRRRRGATVCRRV